MAYCSVSANAESQQPPLSNTYIPPHMAHPDMSADAEPQQPRSSNTYVPLHMAYRNMPVNSELQQPCPGSGASTQTENIIPLEQGTSNISGVQAGHDLATQLQNLCASNPQDFFQILGKQLRLYENELTQQATAMKHYHETQLRQQAANVAMNFQRQLRQKLIEQEEGHVQQRNQDQQQFWALHDKTCEQAAQIQQLQKQVKEKDAKIYEDAHDRYIIHVLNVHRQLDDQKKALEKQHEGELEARNSIIYQYAKIIAKNKEIIGTTLLANQLIFEARARVKEREDEDAAKDAEIARLKVELVDAKNVRRKREEEEPWGLKTELEGEIPVEEDLGAWSPIS